MNRRTFLASFGAAALIPAREGWDMVPEILARIQPPTFPARDFVVTKYGGLNEAIAACAKAGGGRVVIPAGEFTTGAVHLKSNVNLHLAEGAVLRFVHELEKYPLVFTRFEGVECMNYSPFIYALDVENVAITGKGTIDGRAKSGPWYAMNDNSKADRERLLKLAADGVPVEKRLFGIGHNLRPNFIQFYRSKNILVEGVTIKDGPMWTVHPALCSNVTVRNIKIESYGPNTDGVDPESSRDVLIENVEFHTDDDTIAIKSGKNDDGRRVNVPTENVIVRNCSMQEVNRNLMAIGSEVTGGIRNIFVEKCKFRKGLRGLYIKSNTARGGVVENIYFRDIEYEDVAEPVIRIGMDYSSEKGPHKPVFRNFVFERIRAKRAGLAVQVAGVEGSPVRGVRFRDCTFDDVKETAKVKYAEGVEFENVTVNGKPYGSDIDTAIAKNRIGTITIRTAPGAKVSVEQVRHEFWFGATLPTGYFTGRMAPADAAKFNEVFQSNFNAGVIEGSFKWHEMEKEQGVVNYTVVDSMLAWADKNNIPLRGHCIYWGIPNRVQDWVKKLDDDGLRAALKHRGRSIGDRYRGRFAEYDLNNEMIHANYYEQKLGPESIKQMAQAVLDGDSRAKLFVNDYDITTGVKLADYVAHIRKLLDMGVPLAGIGVQGHLHAETFDPAKLEKALDELSQFKLPIRITEFNIPGQRSKYMKDRTLRLTPEEERQKASQLRQFFEICFAHPSVTGIMMWGFWEGANWIPQSSMYKRDWTPLPAAEAYRDLVFNKWWTRWSGAAGADGTVAVQAFYGTHQVTVNGKKVAVTLTKAEGSKTVDLR